MPRRIKAQTDLTQQIFDTFYRESKSHDNWLWTAQFLIKARELFQQMRKSSDNVMRTSEYNKDVVMGVRQFAKDAETDLGKLFDMLAKRDKVCQWCAEVKGIGPVYSLTLRSFIDITRCHTVDNIWRFCGLDPTADKKIKGQKLRYCQKMKNTCHLIGKGFVMQGLFYRDLYEKRKKTEILRNENGQYAEQAKKILEDKNFNKDTISKKAYQKGILPDGHIDARARRHTVKIFLHHWFQMAWRDHYGTEPRYPYVIETLGHEKFISVDDVIAYEKKYSPAWEKARKEKRAINKADKEAKLSEIENIEIEEAVEAAVC